MKKTAYLLCAMMFIAFTFITLPAKAQSSPCYDADPTTGTCPVAPSSGTSMPINSGVIYLLVAGAVLGVMAIKKHKAGLIKA